MVSRTFLAGALAALSAQAVVAGPCRPISWSTVEVSHSSMATDSASATLVPSTETLSTETEILETSLTVPTTDAPTSATIEEATTTTTEDSTTTELATSDATDYQTTEATIVEPETTTAAETTTTAALAVPTTFKLISEGSGADGLALQGFGNMYFGMKPRVIAVAVVLTYDEQTSQLTYNSRTLCLYRNDYSWNAQVVTCPAESNDRYNPLLCETPPTSGELKCRVSGAECVDQGCPPEIPDCPSAPTTACAPTGEEWSQFFVVPSSGISYDLYFGIEDATNAQLAESEFQATSLQILRVDDSVIKT